MRISVLKRDTSFPSLFCMEVGIWTEGDHVLWLGEENGIHHCYLGCIDRRDESISLSQGL